MVNGVEASIMHVSPLTSGTITNTPVKLGVQGQPCICTLLCNTHVIVGESIVGGVTQITASLIGYGGSVEMTYYANYSVEANQTQPAVVALSEGGYVAR